MRRSAAVAGLWSTIALLAVSSAFGHDLRPIFIDISQASETDATLRFKVPSTVARSQLPAITLSEECSAQSEVRVVLRADSYQGEQAFRCATALAGGHRFAGISRCQSVADNHRAGKYP